MVTFLNVSKAPGKNNSLLTAEFYRLNTGKRKSGFGKVVKTIEATPTELVTKVIQEASSLDPRFSFIQSNVPASVRALLNRSLIFHYRATLPEGSTTNIKIEKNKRNKNLIVATICDSQNEYYKGDLPLDVTVIKDKPLEVASKVLDFLNNGFWHEAKLEFEDGIGEDIKELFTEVINLYNQSVSTK